MIRLFGLALLIGAVLAAATCEEPRARAVLRGSLSFSDTLWDEPAGLLRSATPRAGERHIVRESSWYALGLLMRDQPGDEARALRIIDEVLRRQFVAPGERWDGTFQRAPEESLPTAANRELNQFHPATAHWRVGADDVGWLLLRACPAVDARAAPHRLMIKTAAGGSTFRVHARGLTAEAFVSERWALPGVVIAVETDAASFSVTPVAPTNLTSLTASRPAFLLRTTIPPVPTAP